MRETTGANSDSNQSGAEIKFGDKESTIREITNGRNIFESLASVP